MAILQVKLQNHDDAQALANIINANSPTVSMSLTNSHRALVGENYVLADYQKAYLLMLADFKIFNLKDQDILSYQDIDRDNLTNQEQQWLDYLYNN